TASDASKPQNYADYFENFKYEDKDAATYITEQAKEKAIEYAVVQNLFNQYELELTKEDTDNIESYVDYYWEQSLKAMYEPNGVSLATYTDLMRHQYMKSKVFDYYYDKKDEKTGKGGLKTVADSELIKKLAADYVLADIMPGALTTQGQDGTTSSLPDEEKAALKTKFDGFAKKLNDGGKYPEIYKEYTGQEPQAVAAAPQDGSPATIYSTYANVFSADDSDTTMFDLLRAKRDEKDFAYGTAYVLGGDAQGSYYLTMMYDIAKDPYYLNQYRSTLLHALKDDEFDKLLTDEGAKLTVNVDEGLVKYYKPAKIDLDQASQ
ncbi:MAG: hypothetical protein IKU10_07720, partial [Clostridia bacterium]|nr:hypothetical protein [Clostridia bacterium]